MQTDSDLLNIRDDQLLQLCTSRTVWSDPVIRPDSAVPIRPMKNRENSGKFTILKTDKNWTDYRELIKTGLPTNTDGPCKGSFHFFCSSISCNISFSYIRRHLHTNFFYTLIQVCISSGFAADIMTVYVVFLFQKSKVIKECFKSLKEDLSLIS